VYGMPLRAGSMCRGLLCSMQILRIKRKRSRSVLGTCWLPAWDAQGGNWED
jgi:hypothetical protein